MDAQSTTPAEEQNEARQLLERFQAGETEAGYELLGRQASIEQWKTILTALATDSDLDLERVAGSTLGRQPEVVLAVLELLERKRSAKALFVAHAVECLREEPHLIERAAAVEKALLEQNGTLLDEPEADPLQSLYVLLSLPLPAQREHWLLWKDALPEKADAVEQALANEDERLQRLAKERGYRSGTYLHFLRHALANLVLVAGIGGAIGQRAFALLQRRVDDAEQQEELLLVAPEDVRRRYLLWTLELRNAERVPRAHFSLRMLREHFPALASAETLTALSRVEDDELAADAALTALEAGVESRALDLEGMRLLNAVEPERAAVLARAFVRSPARIELAQIAPERRELLFANPADVSPDLLQVVIRQLLGLPVAEIPELVRELDQLPESVVPDGFFSDLTAQLLAIASRDERLWETVVASLQSQRFRRAAWAALPAANGLRSQLVRAALDAEPDDARAAAVAEALASLGGEARDEVAKEALAATFAGTIDPGRLAEVWPEDLRAAALQVAESARMQSESERAGLEAQLRLGEQAHRAELRREIEPLVALAAARASGNAHLEAGYARLEEAIQSGDGGPAAEVQPQDEADAAPELPASVLDELSKLDAQVDGAAPSVLLLPAPDKANPRLRYLGVLDHRAQRGNPAERRVAQHLLPAFVSALADVGLAEVALRNLFEGGPLMPVLVQLSASARERLLEEARRTGFTLPDNWAEHPALGEWLRTHTLKADAGSVADGAADVGTLSTGLRLARDAAAALDSVRSEIERQRHAVKETVMRVAAPVFDEIDALIDSYAQLWQGLARLGISQIAPLGSLIAADAIDPARHEIVAEPRSLRFVVRSPGVEIDGDVVARARLEGLTS